MALSSSEPKVWSLAAIFAMAAVAVPSSGAALMLFSLRSSNVAR